MNESQIPPVEPGPSGRVLQDFTPNAVTVEQVDVVKRNGPVQPDFSLPDKPSGPGAGDGTFGDSPAPYKPFPFALEQGNTNNSTRVYHGRLFAVANRITIDGDGLVEQTGIGNYAIKTPSQFEGGNGQRYQHVDLDWTGNVYLYWETDDIGTVTLCELRGPDEPDHQPLPLPEGVSTGKFSVLIGSTAGDLDSAVQHVASDVWWTPAFVKDDGSSDSDDSGGSSSDSSDSGDSRDSDGSSVPSEESAGSDKSTAIVPASWDPNGYTAMFIAECPEVRFDDVLTVSLKGRVTVVPLDSRYVEVCERDSIKVVGAVADRPAMLGAVVRLHQVVILSSHFPAVVNLRLSGIRKGFKGMRFPSRTRQQFEENEAWINSAYSRNP